MVSQESEQAQEAWYAEAMKKGSFGNAIGAYSAGHSDYRAALKSEIERIKPDDGVTSKYFQGQLDAYRYFLSLLDTVKPKS